jgi:hypothetical protein
MTSKNKGVQVSTLPYNVRYKFVSYDINEDDIPHYDLKTHRMNPVTHCIGVISATGAGLDVMAIRKIYFWWK